MLSVVLIREILFRSRCELARHSLMFNPVEHEVIVQHEISVLDVVVLPLADTVVLSKKLLSARAYDTAVVCWKRQPSVQL